MTLGRDSRVPLWIPGQKVSRHHARIVPLVDGGFELEDLNSSNGTSINGVPIQRRRLQNGDIIQIGTTKLLFRHGT